MKVANVLLVDAGPYPEGKDRTAFLTAEQHQVELLDDGWIRFRTPDGLWHRVPGTQVKRVTECRQISKSDDVSYLAADKNIENAIKPVGAKRKPKTV